MSNAEHTERDYSLLRPFDLEAAKRGEQICFPSGAEITRFIDGPDSDGDFVFLIPRGQFSFAREKSLRMAPLCWVEGRPVYRGDVLYGKGECSDLTYIADKVESGGTLISQEGTSGKKEQPEFLTWTPPKVKREGFVVVNKASVFNSREQAEACRDSFLENTGRFVIGRAEWEEPAEVAK